jgi:hypothetical protein
MVTKKKKHEETTNPGTPNPLEHAIAVESHGPFAVAEAHFENPVTCLTCGTTVEKGSTCKDDGRVS